MRGNTLPSVNASTAAKSGAAVEHSTDGRRLLNLGCGTKTHSAWVNVDFSPYTRLVRHPRLSRLLRHIGVLSAERYGKLRLLDPQIVHWDLRRGIPFPDESFDVVYHSHVLEHLPREQARSFILECRRVLRPSGAVRIVVPDLRQLTEWYLVAFKRADGDEPKAYEQYDFIVEKLLGQMVRTTAVGTGRQPPMLQLVERALRGGPARIGELHSWMYDRVSLRRLLLEAGFRDVREHRFDSSDIPEWNSYGLDRTPEGQPHKAFSCYMEGQRGA